MGTFFLAGPQMPDPQKEAGIQHKPLCVCEPFGHHEPLVSSWESLVSELGLFTVRAPDAS